MTHEPGTGPDWANAKAPQGTRPAPPRTPNIRPWHTIRGRDVPTDAETLTWLETLTTGEPTAETAQARIQAAHIRARAAAGYHDGSLPHLGHYRPVYFIRDDQP